MKRFLIRIPSSVAKDSQFPFKAGRELTITVDPKGKIVLIALRSIEIGHFGAFR